MVFHASSLPQRSGRGVRLKGRSNVGFHVGERARFSQRIGMLRTTKRLADLLGPSYGLAAASTGGLTGGDDCVEVSLHGRERSLQATAEAGSELVIVVHAAGFADIDLGRARNETSRPLFMRPTFDHRRRKTRQNLRQPLPGLPTSHQQRVRRSRLFPHGSNRDVRSVEQLRPVG